VAHVTQLHRGTAAEGLGVRVAAYIERHRLLPEHGEVLVAVSGGADSLCLLHLLHSLCGDGRRFPTVRLQAAHLNHRLRGSQSERDAARVGEIATSWGIPITIGTVDVPALARREKRSLEDAARVARYGFLREVAQGRPIALAHQADDQVETILLHWLRGSGLAGLTGMAPRQQDLIRPLLEVSRAEILAYCREHGLRPLEDESNNDPRFLRNRIRHELLPLLEELNPGIRETLRRSAEVLRVDLAWLEACVVAQWPHVVVAEDEGVIRLHRSSLLRLPLSLQRHLLRHATARLCAGQSPLEPRHYALIESLLAEAQSPPAGRQLALPGALRLVLQGDDLLLEKHERRTASAQSAEEAGEQVLMLPIPGSGVVPGTPWCAHAAPLPPESQRAVCAALQREDWPQVWQLLPRTRYVVYIDGDAAGSSLQVRTRRPGDRIQPLGMQQTKKVQDVLVDQHVPRAERATIPLFFAGTRCIWIAGHCLAESVRLSPATRRIVKLWITR
jgi:tRNA(Ile)-lysidine synthase